MSIPKAARVESFPMQVGNGAVHRSVFSATLEELFGKQPWAAWKQEHDAGKAGATGGQNAGGAQSVAAELTEAEKLRLTTWLSENVGSPPSNGNPTAPTRELLAMVDDIEQGSLKRYRDGIVAHLRAHRTANGSAITPTALRQAVDAAMRHSLGAERDGENSAPKVNPLLDDALPGDDELLRREMQPGLPVYAESCAASPSILRDKVQRPSSSLKLQPFSARASPRRASPSTVVDGRAVEGAGTSPSAVRPSDRIKVSARLRPRRAPHQRQRTQPGIERAPEGSQGCRAKRPKGHAQAKFEALR